MSASSYINDIFSHLDNDSSGRLEYEEALQLFSSQNLTQSDKQKIIQLLDINHDGYIDINEFHHLFKKLNCHSTDDLIEKSYLYIIFNQLNSKNNLFGINQWKHLFEKKNI
eukprot:201130_1